MMAPEGIGALLRGIREAAGLTREEQASVIQAARGGKWFDPENLKRWETERRLPTPMWHALLAECYGRQTEEIVRAVVVSRRRRRLHRLVGAYAEQESALALTMAPSVMTRALIAVDGAVCVRADGDPTVAAGLAIGAWIGLPSAYRDGLVRSRVEALCRTLPGRPGNMLRDALASR